MATYKRGSGNYKSSFINVIMKTADQLVNNSETLVNDLHLKFPLKANKRYAGYIMLRLDSPTAADMDITFNDISGAVNDDFVDGIGNNAENGTAFGTERVIATDAAAEVHMIYFWITTASTAGDLQFKFAQTVATVANTFVRSGSMMVVFEG